MSSGDLGRCRACHTPIRWVVMKSGKRNPLNPFPDAERGNVLLVRESIDADLYGCQVGEAVALGQRDAAYQRARGADLFTSHFATCPKRAQFRSR